MPEEMPIHRGLAAYRYTCRQEILGVPAMHQGDEHIRKLANTDENCAS